MRRAAGLALRQAIIQRYAAEQLAYLDAEADLSPEWIEAATQGDDVLWLSADELRELSSQLRELAERWHDRGDREQTDARPVRIIYSAFLRP